MAWIGIVDPQTLDGQIVARCGCEGVHVDAATLTLREDLAGGTRPENRAWRQQQPVICNDIVTDSCLDGVRKELLANGHKSAGYFPLTLAGHTQAVMALFAREPGAFDEAETHLLLQLAGDISFALNHIQQQERLDYIAYYDTLTGLANRGLFLERLAQFKRGATSGQHKLAVLLIDLERFKNINDGLGRAAGDTLLKLFAEWLTHNLADASVLGRVGGDQFAAVMVPDVHREGDVAQIVEAMLAALVQHPFRLNDAEFRIAARVGVAIFPDDASTADTLLRNAEAAVKKATLRGDRCLFYTHDMTEMVAGKLTLETQLHQALHNGEFVLYYQAKKSFITGELTGAEALIRWNDPRTGLVPPGRFIPVLEETGLIYEVGRWALRQAIDDYLRWQRAGLTPLRIAVNVSPLQVRHRGFVEEIRDAIAIDTQAATGLELELTESLIMEDVANSITTLKAIRVMGVHIAIDDFGTGFSSLSYLSRLPVDTLKIDRSFIHAMTTSPESLELVSTIINLAHSLRLIVVAEGVETEEQARLLRLLNCDEMQGFLLGQPVPRDIFESRYLDTE
jgi:diguanylate cyclase (GGDEF)-like protein